VDVKHLTTDDFARRWPLFKPVPGLVYGEVPFSRLRAAERQGWEWVAINLTAPRTTTLLVRRGGGPGEG